MPVPTSDEKLAWIKLEPPSEAELAAVEALRPGDYEIGFQRTNDILDEALEVFQRSCRSSMGIAGDVMVALFTAGGDLVNAAAGTYLHAIIQPIIVKYIRRHYARNPGIEEGDIWCANDALYGGIHNPDVVCLVPVFHQGELIAWAGAANHTTETGAIEPGGMPVSAQARFEEGMNLPPVKIGQGGELRNDWLEVFSAYGIRAPQMVVTDLKARATAADRVRTRLVELADKEGREWVVGLLRKMLMVAEEGARRRVAAWPEGRFRCVAFSDSLGTRRGLVRSAYLTLEKRGDRLVFDFTGTSPENVSSYHAHVQSTIGHIANYVYSNVFYDLPISSATFAPMEFRIPRGTVLNPDDRAATSNAVMICTGAMSTTPNCFAKLMFSSRSDWQRAVASLANAGNAMVIAGLSQWGLPFADMIAYSINTEGQGGRPTMKGMDSFGFPWCPFGRAPDVELMENEFPMLIPISQHWPDSCGHGKYRGGVGTVQVWVAHQAPTVYFNAIADNSKIQTPQPLFGGYAPCTVPGLAVRGADFVARLATSPVGMQFHSLIDRDQVPGQWEVEFFGRSVRPYGEGDVMTFGFSSGGAGYGDPLEADPDSVAEDIREGKLTQETARRVYCVAYDQERQVALREETERLRQQEREARLRRGRPYAEFLAEWQRLRPPEEVLVNYGSWPDARPVQPVVRM
ncbi:MAG TPA: hydantoinase B/oxoprolinase family protein [Candidatus Dormibacteraeota bacterium]|nr:hydantoinase B/oxoprolinase family protein [Candidatus Dormibacteraeota bacterium]